MTPRGHAAGRRPSPPPGAAAGGRGEWAPGGEIGQGQNGPETSRDVGPQWAVRRGPKGRAEGATKGPKRPRATRGAEGPEEGPKGQSGTVTPMVKRGTGPKGPGPRGPRSGGPRGAQRNTRNRMDATAENMRGRRRAAGPGPEGRRRGPKGGPKRPRATEGPAARRAGPRMRHGPKLRAPHGARGRKKSDGRFGGERVSGLRCPWHANPEPALGRLGVGSESRGGRFEKGRPDGRCRWARRQRRAQHQSPFWTSGC